jgi:hypothetical protein
MYTSSGDPFCYPATMESNSKIHINRKTISLTSVFHITSTRWPTVRPLRSCGNTLKYLPPCLNYASGRAPLLFQHVYCSSYLFRLPIFYRLSLYVRYFIYLLFPRCHATTLMHVDIIIPAFSAIHMNSFLVQPCFTGAIMIQRSL